MTEVRYVRNKYNTDYNKVTKAVCKYCLEKSTFRVIQKVEVNEATGNTELQNRLACTRCLNSCRYNKKYKPIQHPVIKVTHFTKQDYIRRTWLRCKRYFLGDHLYGPFKRKRTK